jgi:5-formyltetrahydrofolate cyclo-ligase
LGFTEQIEDEIPTLPHDRVIDLVLTPDADVAASDDRQFPLP